MKERFFVEFRPWPRRYIREYAENANRQLMLLGSERIWPPHIMLYGPSEIDDLDRVARAVMRVALDFQLVKIRTGGFGYFDNPSKKWVVVNIKPNQKLEDLRYGLYQELRKISPPGPLDKPRFKFHVSIGKTANATTYSRLCKKVSQWTCPDMEQFLLRISIINGQGKIHCEYDLLQKRLLNREESQSDSGMRRTLSVLRTLLRQSSVSPRHVSILNRISGFFRKLFH
jgi:2'-5' RNA ligase